MQRSVYVTLMITDSQNQNGTKMILQQIFKISSICRDTGKWMQLLECPVDDVLVQILSLLCEELT